MKSASLTPPPFPYCSHPFPSSKATVQFFHSSADTVLVGNLNEQSHILTRMFHFYRLLRSTCLIRLLPYLDNRGLLRTPKETFDWNSSAGTSSIWSFCTTKAIACEAPEFWKSVCFHALLWAHIFLSSFFLGWLIPHLITGLSRWWSPNESLLTQETVPDRCRPSSWPTRVGTTRSREDKIRNGHRNQNEIGIGIKRLCL